MRSEKYTLSPPSLDELVNRLKGPLEANYTQTSISVAQCPDLRQHPFNLAVKGLSGNEKIADVGGQPNLFPRPKLDNIWSMADIAQAMEMSAKEGALLGAGAGPFHHVGQNSELSPNLSWENGFDNLSNGSHIAQIIPKTGAVSVEKSPSADCGLMINLFGSENQTGPVLKITAKGRKGSEKSFTECVQKALAAAYGDQTISLGGVLIIKSGRANFHVMPDFPAEKDLPFKNAKAVNNWLTYHEFDGPIVCLSVLHSADPDKKMGLRMEHTHGYSTEGENTGGHYHYDIEGFEDDVEYEAYFNTAKVVYRLDRPTATLERDLHD